jgi:tripartite-type tricarboxylate transporter receptor subunit TctC
MRQLLATLFAGVVLTAPVVSRAQSTTDYPTRPIRLVVGFAPGGATDLLAHLLTGALGQELGQTIYVENIAGASGYVAWRNVAHDLQPHIELIQVNIPSR